MITLQVTSDSSVPELHIARRVITEMIELRGDVSLGVANVDKRWKPSLNEIAEHFKVPLTDELRGNSVDTLIVDEVFNATELAEAETLGKPVCSTVVASQSTTAPVDTQANTSLPEPTSVFGRPAQPTENAVNPVVPVTETPVLDADGLTWDSRIHSSSKELNKDGTWRKRRGVNTDLVTQVEAELRGEVPAPKPPVDHSHEGETPVFTATIPTEIGMQEVSQPVMQANPLPVGGSMTFPELLDGVTKAMVAGQLTQARINEALNSIGVQALPHLIARTDLIPAFREALGGVV